MQSWNYLILLVLILDFILKNQHYSCNSFVLIFLLDQKNNIKNDMKLRQTIIIKNVKIYCPFKWDSHPDPHALGINVHFRIKCSWVAEFGQVKLLKFCNSRFQWVSTTTTNTSSKKFSLPIKFYYPEKKKSQKTKLPKYILLSHPNWQLVHAWAQSLSFYFYIRNIFITMFS